MQKNDMISMTQPTALFLADILEDACKPADIAEKCAAELRCLHAELERCKQVCAATSENWRTDAEKWKVAEPVHEPVAWLWKHRETGRPRFLMPNERTATDVAYAWDVVGPLYLAPPQRKPLSTEQILDLFDSHNVYGTKWVEFARAVERAHGIT